MKRLLTTLLLIVLCSAVYALDYDSPYDPGAARTDLSNVSGAADLTLSGKVRAAWVDILGNVYASGSAIVGAGSAAAPSYSTVGDGNTGIYFPAGDTVGISAGGAEKMRVTGGGEVLIGTTTDSGAYKLQVAGNVYANGVTTEKTEGVTTILNTTAATTIAVDAIATLSVLIPNGGQSGIVEIYDRTDASAALYCISGGNNLCRLMTYAGPWSVTKDTAASMNVYSVGGGKYEIQNKRTFDCVLYIRFVGRKDA